MNIADSLSQMSIRYPSKDAVRFPIRTGKSYRYDTINFRELEDLSNRFANGLIDMGFKRGDKTLLFVRPSLKFHALVFALFKIGVAPILIDPGMGRQNLLIAIEEVKPTGLIAEGEVHFLSLLFRKTFESIKLKVTTNSWSLFNLKPLAKLEKSSSKPVSVDMGEDELAAILFTSGGTGRPKGVMYSHKIFSEQTRILKELFSLTEKDVDLPGFPLFSLFTLCMGMTSCVPDMDPSKPSKADPLKLLANIRDNEATFVAGSPSIWKNLATYCVSNNIQLPSVKYLVMFGAPIRNEVHEQFKQILPNGSTYTPYGATESLPVANISGRTVLEETAKKTEQGEGTCVGYPAPGIDITIVKVSDNIIESIEFADKLAPLEIGEILVKGDVVTKSYYESPVETARAKVKDGNGFWHRMGDMGYLDDKGRLWFCGRKTHRAQTEDGLICSVNTEAIFNKHKAVNKAALVALGEKGKQKVSIVIERNKNGKKINKQKLQQELLDLAKTNDKTKSIESIHFHDSLPVDIRHNIKIDRTKLAQQVSAGEI